MEFLNYCELWPQLAKVNDKQNVLSGKYNLVQLNVLFIFKLKNFCNENSTRTHVSNRTPSDVLESFAVQSGHPRKLVSSLR